MQSIAIPHVKQAVILAYMVFLAWRGLFGGPRFASWHMFAWAERSFVRLKYEDENGRLQPLNHWDHIPHTAIVGNIISLKFLIYYLHVIKGLNILGTAEIHRPKDVLQISISNRVLKVRRRPICG